MNVERQVLWRHVLQVENKLAAGVRAEEHLTRATNQGAQAMKRQEAAARQASSRVSASARTQAEAFNRVGASANKASATIEHAGGKAASALRRLPAAAREAAAGFVSMEKTSTRSLNATERRARYLGGTIRRLAGAGLALGGGFLAFQKAKSAIESTTQLGHSTEILSRNLGISTQKASAFLSIAQARGASDTQLSRGFSTLATRVERVTLASNKQAPALAKLAHESGGLTKQQQQWVATATASTTGSNTQIKTLDRLKDSLVGVTTKGLSPAQSAQQSLLKSTVSSADTGAKAAQKTAAQLRALGLSQADITRGGHDFNFLLDRIADGFDKMKGGTQRAALAQQLLGRNWQTLLPLMRGGSKGLEDNVKQAQSFGAALDEHTVKQLEKLHDQQIKMKEASIGMKVAFTEVAIPIVTRFGTVAEKVAQDLTDKRWNFSDRIKHAFQDLRGLNIGPTFGHIVQAAIPAMVQAFVTGGPVMAEALVKAFISSGPIGILLGGAWILRKIGVFGVIGQSISRRLAGPITSAIGASPEAGLAEAKGPAIGEAEALGTAIGEAIALRISAGVQAGVEGGMVKGGAAAVEGATAGGLLLPVGVGRGAAKGAASAAGAAKAGGAAAQIEQQGLMATLFGTSGASTLRSKVGTVLGTAGKGLLFGLFGQQLGQLGGGLVGGKHGAALGSVAGLGAGIGFGVAGPVGALIGGGAAVGVKELTSLSGNKDNAAAVRSYAAKIKAAGVALDVNALKGLSYQAKQAAKPLHDLGQDKTARQFEQLARAASSAAQKIQNQRAGGAVVSIERAVAGSRYTPTVAQISAATVSRLASVGPQAQKLGAAAIVRFTAGMESQKRLPVGSTNRLIRQLEAYYGPGFAQTLGRYGLQSMAAITNGIKQGKVVDAVQRQVDQMHTQWGLLVPDVTVTSKNIQQVMTSNIEAMRQKVLHTQGAERADAAQHLNALLALYAQYTPLIAQAGSAGFASLAVTVTGVLNQLGKTLSGSLGGWVTLISQFAGAVTPALSTIAGAVTSGTFATPTGAKGVGDALGKGLKALGIGNAAGGYPAGLVPGDPSRDGTLALLSGREFILTGGGQAMMDMHAPGLLDHIEQHQPRHFVGGGSFSGRASTFGPPLEPAHSTATNIDDSHPGVALRLPGTSFGDPRNEANKLKWFQVLIDGKGGATQMIDIGPNQSTGRNVDVTGRQAQEWGLWPFPTDHIAHVTPLIGGQHGRPADGSAKKGVKTFVGANRQVTYSPIGPGLQDAYFRGYSYGADPTSGIGAAGGLREAIAGAQYKATVGSAPAGLHITLPKGITLADLGKTTGLKGSQKLAGLQHNMTTAAAHFLGRPYAAAGGAANGRPPNWGASALDCSAYVSSIINLGGKGMLPPVGPNWTTDNLKGWGVGGNGRYVTVGVRGTSGSDAHTMINFFGRYAESSHPGKGPHWDAGWSEDFPIRRHPPGLRAGGRIPSRRGGGRVTPTGPGNWNDGGWWNRKYGNTVRRFVGGGSIAAGGFGAPAATAPTLGPNMIYNPAQSLSAILQLLAPLRAPAGLGTSSLTRGLGRTLGRQTAAIGGAGSNAAAAHALALFEHTIDNVRKISYGGLLEEARRIQREISRAARHGDSHEVRRLQQALALVNRAAGQRVGKLVKAATDEGASLQGAEQKLTNMMTRKGIDQASAQGTAMLAKFRNASVAVLQDEVKKLQRAYALAKKEGNKRALGDIGAKLGQALSDLDDATAQAAQALVDALQAAKQQIEDTAQAAADKASHGVSMAEGGEQLLELQQQLAGTFDKSAGGAARAANITSTILPAIQAQIAALQQQQQAASSVGDTTLADQIAEAILNAQQDYASQSLAAQQATAANTSTIADNTSTLAGTLAVSAGGVANLPDISALFTGA